uniref:hypothetical protein n=1 Tax=Burkholderia gladioli TaxID=28095 RepID=UPI001FC8041E
MKIDHIEDILRCSFGLWISGLFSAISGWNSGITFQEQREAFFGLLEQLLNEGKIKFCPPNEFWCEGYDVWDADADTILEYLRSRWPIGASSEKDVSLTNYFYDMPAILWVAPGECQNFRVRGGLSITRMAGQNALRRGWQTDSWLPSNHARRVP